MIGFEAKTAPRLCFGNGTIDRIGRFARELNARKVLLVTDPGIVASGHAAKLRDIISKAECAVSIFDGVIENPTTRQVERCAAQARTVQADLLVGLGGGSSLDTAKGANFLLSGGGVIEDYVGYGKARGRMLPFIAVPTTAGTGSECQSYALINHPQTHLKMACGDPGAMARIAVLDPNLTLTQPAPVTAATALDAISHALESAVCRASNEISLLYAKESFRLLMTNFKQVLDEPNCIEARGALLLGAAFAGLAIENSMLGCAHSLANPLTARYEIVHGQAIGLMLPHVLRFNGTLPDVARTYAEFVNLASMDSSSPCPLPADPLAAGWQATEILAAQIEALRMRADLATSLESCGIARNELASLAAEAADQWTARFNPRAASAADLEKIYEEAYFPRSTLSKASWS